MTGHSIRNDKILEAYKNSSFVKAVTARKLGIAEANFYTMLSQSPQLCMMMDAAKAERLDIAEKKLFELIEEGDFRAIKFFLETKGRERGYGNAIEVSHIDDTKDIQKALRRKYENIPLEAL